MMIILVPLLSAIDKKYTYQFDRCIISRFIVTENVDGFYFYKNIQLSFPLCLIPHLLFFLHW